MRRVTKRLVVGSCVDCRPTPAALEEDEVAVGVLADAVLAAAVEVTMLEGVAELEEVAAAPAAVREPQTF